MYGSIKVRGAEEILKDAVANVVARTLLTDLLPADPLTQVLNSAALEQEQLYLQVAKLVELFSIDRAKGTDLTLRGDDYNEARKGPVYAVGTVVFTRTAHANPLTIPKGTEVGSQSGLKYITLTDVTIPGAASTSAAVGILATVAGSSHNVATGGISIILSSFQGDEAKALAVTNPAPIDKGLEIEADDAYRARLKDKERSLNRTSPDALPAQARKVLNGSESVESSLLIEDALKPGEFKLYIDNGSGTTKVQKTIGSGAFGDGEVLIDNSPAGMTRFWLKNPPVALDAAGVPIFTLFQKVGAGAAVQLTLGVDYGLIVGHGEIQLVVATAATTKLEAHYTYHAGLVQQVQWYLDGRASDPNTYPGGRAAGARCIVQPAEVYKPALTVTVTIGNGYDATTVKNAVRDALLSFVNSLPIGGDVILAELYDTAMDVDGVDDFIVNVPAPADPPANVAVATHQVVRLTSGDITVQ